MMQKKYILEKPDSVFTGSSEVSLILANMRKAFGKELEWTEYPKYLYWDKAKYKIPPDIKTAEFWSLIKIRRNSNKNESVIRSEDGHCFTWRKLSHYESLLHELDLHMGGELLIIPGEIKDMDKQKYISRGMMEEAIASSQLEGAVTTRAQAKQFLREGRKPINYAEHMILNNYRSMQAVEEEYKNRNLDLPLLFELHTMITQNTIEAGCRGVFRTDADNIQVVSNNGEFIYFIPPKEAFVRSEMNRLIDFANDQITTDFIHPIIKAIILHFWIGYLHPFVDGNGRLARLLFYWYLLKKGYWAFAYLPISTMIKKSAEEYKMAYVYTEQDDYDLTYFIDYNIRKIELAKKDFEHYLAAKTEETQRIRVEMQDKYHLNHRQVALLQYLNEHKDSRTNPKMHANIYGVSKLTAIHDLKDLLKKDLVRAKRVGKNVFYFPTDMNVKLFK